MVSAVLLVEAPRWHIAASFGTVAVAIGVGKARKSPGRLARRRRAMVRASATAPGPSLSVEDLAGVCDQTGVTMNRYLIELSKRNRLDTDMLSILNSISEASKVIAKLVKRAPLAQAELLGFQGEINVQGEDQKKLDVITNEVLKKALMYTGKLVTLASEEEDSPVAGAEADDTMPGLVDSGQYVCVFDPLDGSSNVDAGIAVGTIFGIFKEPSDGDTCDLPFDLSEIGVRDAQCLAGTLQPGKELVAAGYVLYSCSTELVMTVGGGCVGFTLDTSFGEFVLTRPKIVIPPRGKIYSMNEAKIAQWDKPMRDYVTAIQRGEGETGQAYSLRYIGSMVGDVHRTLLYGGIFAYPADAKNKDGKLRLLYEAAPMAFILEQAGGKAITGYSRVMDVPPKAVHQRVPVILGSPEDVAECQKFYEACEDPTLRKRCTDRLSLETVAA